MHATWKQVPHLGSEADGWEPGQCESQSHSHAHQCKRHGPDGGGLRGASGDKQQPHSGGKSSNLLLMQSGCLRW